MAKKLKPSTTFADKQLEFIKQDLLDAIERLQCIGSFEELEQRISDIYGDIVRLMIGVTK